VEEIAGLIFTRTIGGTTSSGALLDNLLAVGEARERRFAVTFVFVVVSGRPCEDEGAAGKSMHSWSG
jgi:hypothetical protein